MDPWHYETARDLDQSLVERLRNFPREPDMFVYGARLTATLMVRSWLRLYHRLKITGRENLPVDRSFVLVANHASHLDVLCLLSSLPLGKVHRAFPAAARDYFFVSAPRAIAAAIVVNALPFDRGILGWQSLGVCGQLLQNPGNILVLFPEGTRSTTGNIGEFKPGIGLLVAGTDVPVVPCYLHGAGRAWPKGCWVPRPRQVRVTIGAPRVYGSHVRGKASAQEICRELREAVLELVPGSEARTPDGRMEEPK